MAKLSRRRAPARGLALRMEMPVKWGFLSWLRALCDRRMLALRPLFPLAQARWAARRGRLRGDGAADPTCRVV